MSKVINAIRGIIITLLFVCAGLALYVEVTEYQAQEQEIESGICSECGKGNLELIDAMGHRTNTTYLYKCDNCGYKIESYYLK